MYQKLNKCQIFLLTNRSIKIGTESLIRPTYHVAA
jgi:hypothetical protein